MYLYDFVFMQDSAPSHRAKATKNFLRDNTPDFISSQEWTPHSPDLNSLDYSVWDLLHELVYEGRREPFANLKDHQNVIRDKWHDVDDQTVRKAILQWKAFSSCGKAEWRTYSAHFLPIS